MKPFFLLAAIFLQMFALCGAGWGQAYTRIVSPVQGQCVPGPDVRVQFVAGGVTLAPGGYNLHFKLDDEPFHVQYRGSFAHVFRNVTPGTHTVRMYIANSLHEAVPGTLSTVTFSVAHPDGANAVVPDQPYITWNLPQGEYIGADATNITLDFLLTNAALAPGGLQVAYYVGGRRFLIQDNCHIRHIKNLEPGLHRIRIELQDANGDLVPGPFNSGERVIAVSPFAAEGSGVVEADVYWNAPRIASIPGRATMGGPRPVVARVLTEVEIERQGALTVNREGRQLRLDGSVISEDITPGRRPDLDGPSSAVPGVVAVPDGAFTVREGGEPDADGVTDLDVVESDNVIRGSVVVRQGEPADAEAESLHEDAEEAGEAGTRAAEPDDDDGDADEAVDATDDEDAGTTRPTLRRRADGSVSRVERTTETVRLSDRPSLRQTVTETTRTVRAATPTTGTVVRDVDGGTTGAARVTTGTVDATSDGVPAVPVVTGATPEAATSLTGTPAAMESDVAQPAGTTAGQNNDASDDNDGVVGDDEAESSDNGAASPNTLGRASEDDGDDGDSGTAERTVRSRAPQRERADDEGREPTGSRRDGERPTRRGRREPNATRDGFHPPMAPPGSRR